MQQNKKRRSPRIKNVTLKLLRVGKADSALGRQPAPSPRRCCAAQRVRLRRLSPRPIPADVGNLRGTPENVGRQGLRQARGSIYWQAPRRGECCSNSRHGSCRKRGAFALTFWPPAQNVNAPQRSVCCQSGWGKGGNREMQAGSCAGAEDVHDEASYADATSVARRAAGASPHTQGGNASLFDGGKSGGHRRADSGCFAARAPSSH